MKAVIKKSFVSSADSVSTGSIQSEKTGGVTRNNPIYYTKTGSWRTQRLIIDEGCVRCGLCVGFCPENCISLGAHKIKINYLYCKGCGICAQVCPKKAIIQK